MAENPNKTIPAGSDTSTPRPKFSVVLPAFNEQENLPELHRRLSAVLEKMGSYELVFIDDGSSDQTWKTIGDLAIDSHVVGLRFSRNFGHHVALTAGLDAARGEFVITMDADLQDQPEEIPKLYDKLQEGYDSVFGIRAQKKHSFFKRLSSALFVRILGGMTESPVPINTNIFRIMSAQFVSDFRRLGERDRFVTGLFSWMGYRQTGVQVEHGERFAGQTKYDLGRMLRLASTGMVAFSTTPLKKPLWLGLFLILLTVAYGIWLLVDHLAYQVPIQGWSWVLLAVFGLSGVQLACLGIHGIYLGRVYQQAKGRPLYLIQETTPRRDNSGEEPSPGD